MEYQHTQDFRPRKHGMTIYYKAVASCLAIILTFAPLTGQAWFFSFPSAFAESPTDIAEPEPPSPWNIQNMNLLSPIVAMAGARKATNPQSDITIDGESALSAEIGPTGTLADLVDDGGANIPTSVYVVQPGDSVAAISKRFGISENTLRFANSIPKGGVVHRGDILLILPINGVTHTVKSGESLSSIGKKYQLETEGFQAFLDFNNLEAGSVIRVGEKLVIPGVEIQVPASSSSSSSKKTTTSSSKSSSSAKNVTRGYFIKPVPCRTSQGKHDVYAVDLACGKSGVPIKAAADGVVVRASHGWSGGYGELVVIQHPNSMITFYAHMLVGSMKVSVGDQVKQGQVIGSIGSTGRSTGPHLHFEVRNGVNPGFDATGSAWKPWN